MPTLRLLLRVLRGGFFVSFLVFPSHATILFQSNFESSGMYLAQAIKPGAKKIELLPSPDIPKWWPENGGEGIIEPNYPNSRETFQYALRKENTLTGVTGISKPHAEHVSLKTGGLGEWYTFDREIESNTKGRVKIDSRHPLGGTHSARFEGDTGTIVILMKVLPSPTSDELHARFRVRFSQDFALDPLATLNFFYFRVGSLVSPKLRVTQEGKRLFLQLARGPSEKIEKVEGNNRVLLSRGKIHTVAFSFRALSRNETLTRWQVDGRAQGSGVFRHEPFGSRKYGVTMGKAGDHLFRGHYTMDNLVVSDVALAPPPTRPKVFFVKGRLTTYPTPTDMASAATVASQWQIAEDNSWLMPAFNSGQDTRNLSELPHPGLTFLPEPLFPYFRYPDRVPVWHGLQSGDPYLARVRHLGPGGQWSPWSIPLGFTLPEHPTSEKQKHFVKSIYLTDPGKRRQKQRIQKGKWYDLHIRFTPTGSEAFLDICFTGDPENTLRNHFRRSGFFRARDNYGLSISFLDQSAYARQTEKDPYSTRLLGKEGLFCRDTKGSSQYQPGKGYARTQFRLLEKAVSGIWQVGAFLAENEKGVSPYHSRLLLVESTAEAGERTHKKRRSAFAAGALACGLLLILFAAWRMVRNRRNRSGSLASQIPKPEVTQNQHIRSACDFIADNLGKPISLHDVAAAINLSPEWLASLFREETGKSVLQYINEARIQKAIDLLKNTDQRMNEIAFQVGFNSVANFNRTFKKIAGTSPTSVRESA